MSESDLLNHLRRTAAPDSRVTIHIGDDLAALNWNAGDLLLAGADQVLDGVHFDSKVHSPRAIGRKAMNRNLSDCAAMACVPVAALATIALPRGVGDDYARELIEGIREAAAAFRCVLVGGDTGSWPNPLAVSVTVLGRSAGLTPVTRGGAKAGDRLYVSGALGGSIRGRHMTFRPRVDLAIELAARHPISAMLDLSDGLSRDLPRLCEASRDLGAFIDASRVPIHDDVAELKDGRPAIEHALHDGEDYELLFASPDTIEHPLITCIGELTAVAGIWLRNGDSATPLVPHGWEHSL